MIITSTMLSVISWNIFADVKNLEWRTVEIGRVIKSLSPDVVCLQEVLYMTFLVITNVLDEYESVYENPYANNTSGRAYGEMILVKKTKISVVGKFFTPLVSSQGRAATFVDILTSDGKRVRISTAHLESGVDKEHIRDKQVEKIEHCVKDAENWIWVGDSNYETHKDKFQCNLTTWYENRFWKGERTASYDKVLTNQTVREISLVGDFKVGEKWLSDHNGILVLIE
jgi:endonuclease/exonuclease/phosphatase family metal-dependent hydrolase